MGTKAKGKKGQEGGASGISSQEGKLEQIRVKKLKFTLKGSNYEDAQNAGLSGEIENEAGLRGALKPCAGLSTVNSDEQQTSRSKESIGAHTLDRIRQGTDAVIEILTRKIV